MEALFDLIFGNLAFIIVVIGGIISFLKRANQNQNQTQNRKQTAAPIQTEDQKRPQSAKDKRVKTFIPQLDDLLGEITKHLEEQNQKQQPTVHQTETLKPKIVTAIKAEEVVPDNEILKPHFEYVSRNTAAPREMVHHSIDLKEMNRKKVIEGVIWGEILGPPRARKKNSYSHLKRG